MLPNFIFRTQDLALGNTRLCRPYAPGSSKYGGNYAIYNVNLLFKDKTIQGETAQSIAILQRDLCSCMRSAFVSLSLQGQV